MLRRIRLHLCCPCRNWEHLRFHLAGVIRELVPKRWQEYVK